MGLVHAMKNGRQGGCFECQKTKKKSIPPRNVSAPYCFDAHRAGALCSFLDYAAAVGAGLDVARQGVLLQGVPVVWRTVGQAV